TGRAGGPAFTVARYLGDGQLDKTFGLGGWIDADIIHLSDDRLNALALLPDGKILAAGYAIPAGKTNAQLALVRYTNSGQWDVTPVVAENSPGGTFVGNITTLPLEDGPYTYKLLDGSDPRFVLAGNQIRVATGAVLDYETARSYRIRVRSTNSSGFADGD